MRKRRRILNRVRLWAKRAFFRFPITKSHLSAKVRRTLVTIANCAYSRHFSVRMGFLLISKDSSGKSWQVLLRVQKMNGLSQPWLANQILSSANSSLMMKVILGTQWWELRILWRWFNLTKTSLYKSLKRTITQIRKSLLKTKAIYTSSLGSLSFLSTTLAKSTGFFTP